MKAASKQSDEEKLELKQKLKDLEETIEMKNKEIKALQDQNSAKTTVGMTCKECGKIF